MQPVKNANKEWRGRSRANLLQKGPRESSAKFSVYKNAVLEEAMTFGKNTTIPQNKKPIEDTTLSDYSGYDGLITDYKDVVIVNKTDFERPKEKKVFVINLTGVWKTKPQKTLNVPNDKENYRPPTNITRVNYLSKRPRKGRKERMLKKK